MAKKYMGVITLQELMNILKEQLGQKINASALVTNLESTANDAPLAASQGKALKDLINGLVGEDGGVENAKNAETLGGKSADSFVLVDDVLASLEAIVAADATLTGKVAGAAAVKALNDALKTVQKSLGNISASNPPIGKDDVVTDLDGEYDEETDSDKPASAGVVKDLKDQLDELEEKLDDQIESAIDQKKGTPGGLAELGEDGKVPSNQLPSYVDDVIEGYYVDDNAEDADGDEYVPDWNFYEPGQTEGVANKGDKIVGEKGKIYVDLTTNKTYRWSGSTYIEISSNDMVEITADEVQKIWEEVLAAH